MSANPASELSRSLWLPAPQIAMAPLPTGGTADLVVVGGGVAGLSVAYEALQVGRKVIVLDRASIGAGMTLRTTAHLSSASDDWFHKFIALRGEEDARALFESMEAAIHRIEEICRAE